LCDDLFMRPLSSSPYHCAPPSPFDKYNGVGYPQVPTPFPRQFVDSPSPTAYPQALTPFESVDLKFDAVLTSGGPAVNFLDHVSMPPLLLSYAGPAVNRASIPPIPSTYASSATNLFDQIAAVPSSLPATTDFDPAVAAHPQVPGPAPSSSDASVLSDEEWEMLLFEAEGCLSADDE
jgi:hypothetical protein